MQLLDYDISPENISLPDYKQFAKYPYWSVLEIKWKEFKELADVLWYTKWGIIEYVASHVWTVLEVEVINNTYQWKDYPIIKRAIMVVDWYRDIQRWVSTSNFIINDNTTIEDIEALWFDNKFVKKSLEYEKIINTIDIQIDDLF